MLLVFGSINLDLIFSSARHPLAGETILGAGFATSPGGKGANQAVAAAKDAAGLPVVMVGAVGSDAFAAPALDQLEKQGVDLTHLMRVDAPTGTACICVEGSGENRILVASGANQALAASAVPQTLLAQCTVLLMQNEIAMLENRSLAQRAKTLGKAVILNAAPALPLVLSDWSGLLDVLIVNEGELAMMAGSAMGVEEASAHHLAHTLASLVIVTLGEAGILAVHPDGSVIRQPALPITPVDTTGAGDTFCGVFAAAMARGEPLATALRRASVAGSLACLALGAQTAIPARQMIDKALLNLSS